MNQSRRCVLRRVCAARAAAFFFACAMLCNSTAYAHSLYIFATQRGDQVEGKVYFRGGSGAAGAKVEVYDADGAKRHELTCDEEGRFRFQPGFSGKMRLVGILEDGHATEYELGTMTAETGNAASETPNRAAPGDDVPPNGSGRRDPRSGPALAAETGPAATGESIGEPSPLPAAIERLRDEVIRLREDIQTSRNRAEWRDVLGGIGYILGLTGIAFYLSARRRASRGDAKNLPPAADRARGAAS